MSKGKHSYHSVVSTCPRCGLFWARSSHVPDLDTMALRPDVLVLGADEVQSGRRSEHKDQALWRVAEDLCSGANRSVLDS